jgi:hypothetical protein
MTLNSGDIIMGKINIFVWLAIALIGGIIAGTVVGFIIGPQDTRRQNINEEIPDPPYEILNGQDSNSDPDIAPRLDAALIGRWEVISFVDVDDIDNSGILSLKFNPNGEGRAEYTESTEMDFTWRAERNRLTITPADDTVFIIYEYEISDDILTIFENLNRTSYIEFKLVDDDSNVPSGFNNTIVGRWRVMNHVDVDADEIEYIADTLEFQHDGVAITLFTDTQISYEFGWRIEGNRLVIIPPDDSLETVIYDYEIYDDIFTLFYNTNRTSYTEYERIDID